MTQEQDPKTLQQIEANIQLCDQLLERIGLVLEEMRQAERQRLEQGEQPIPSAPVVYQPARYRELLPLDCSWLIDDIPMVVVKEEECPNAPQDCPDCS